MYGISHRHTLIQATYQVKVFCIPFSAASSLVPTRRQFDDFASSFPPPLHLVMTDKLPSRGSGRIFDECPAVRLLKLRGSERKRSLASIPLNGDDIAQRPLE